MVVTKGVLAEMMKLGLSEQCDKGVRRKVLELLGTWAVQLRVPHYAEVYDHLRSRGIRPPHTVRPVPFEMAQPPQCEADAAPSGSPAGDDSLPEDIDTLLADLTVAANFVVMLNDLLDRIDPADSTGAIDDDVVSELTDKCRQMQPQVMGLVESVKNEVGLRTLMFV